MSVFHPANPPEPKKQHGPIPSWVLIVQISNVKAPSAPYLINNRHMYLS